jgi:hypothetical protein
VRRAGGWTALLAALVAVALWVGTTAPRRAAAWTRGAAADSLSPNAPTDSAAGGTQTAAPLVPPAVQAPRARYYPLARLEGFRMPEGDPWAPDRSALLLVRRDGLYVFEATKPTDPPRRILQAQILGVCWSPDGTWVGCRVRVPTVVRASDVHMKFVSAAGGPADTRTPRARIGPFLWAEDGGLYFWDARHGTRARMEPPSSWKQRQPRLPETRPAHLLVVPEAGHGHREHAILFTASFADRAATEEIVSSLAAPGVKQLKVAAAFPAATPDSARFLVHMTVGNSGARTYVVNARGERLTRLGEVEDLPAFVGTSVSADGKFVAGYRPRQGQGSFATSQLWLADADGHWSTKVEDAERAVAVRLAHTGVFVAFEDPVSNTDLVHVGRVDVKPLP